MVGVTAVIPHISPRTALLRQALDSVLSQTKPIEKLARAAVETGADVVYSPCRAVSGGRVLWESIGQSFDPELLQERPYIYITSLARTKLAQEAKFDADWDEWGFYRRLHRLGAKFTLVPDVTWEYRGGYSTAGQGDRW